MRLTKGMKGMTVEKISGEEIHGKGTIAGLWLFWSCSSVDLVLEVTGYKGRYADSAVR